MKLRSIVAAIITSLGFDSKGKKNRSGSKSGSKSTLDINKGFKIDEPNLFIPWHIDEKKLIELFEGSDLKHVTTGYYVAPCLSLDTVSCMLGFHFEPRKSGRLHELEFFRTDYSDQRKSFDEFQEAFTKSFGVPLNMTQGDEGFNNYEWRIGNVQIVHFVFDRFGPEEHMRIRKIQ